MLCNDRSPPNALAFRCGRGTRFVPSPSVGSSFLTSHHTLRCPSCSFAGLGRGLPLSTRPNNRRMPSGIVRGCGGQPGMSRSIGSRSVAPSFTSAWPTNRPPPMAQAPTLRTSAVELTPVAAALRHLAPLERPPEQTPQLRPQFRGERERILIAPDHEVLAPAHRETIVIGEGDHALGTGLHAVGAEACPTQVITGGEPAQIVACGRSTRLTNTIGERQESLRGPSLYTLPTTIW